MRNKTRAVARITWAAAGAIAGLSAFSRHASANSETWISTTDGFWGTAANWSNSIAPGSTSSTTSTDTATFNNSVGVGVPINSTTQNIGSISFDTSAGNYVVGSYFSNTGSNSLLLSNGGSISLLSTLAATNATEAITAPLVIEGSSGSYTFSNNAGNGSVLLLTGSITGSNAALTLAGSNTSSNLISGNISDGTGSLTKNGLGTWILSGANSYSGGTAINAGTLQAKSAAALPGYSAGNHSLESGLSVASNATLIFNYGGASDWTSAQVTDFTNYGGPSSGSVFGLDTTDGNGTYAGNLGNLGSGVGITKFGANTLILNDATSMAIGPLAVNKGTLQLGDGNGDGNVSTPSLTFTGSGTLNVDEGSSSSQSLGTLAFSAGDATVQSTYVGTSATVNFSSPAVRTAGATANYVASGGTLGTTNVISITGQSTGYIDQGTFFGGSNYAYYDATGFVRGVNYGVDASSQTTAGGATFGTTSAGTLQQTTGAVTAQTTASIASLNMTVSSGTLTLAGGATLTTNGILKSGGSAATITGGTGIQAGSGAEFVVRTDQSTDSLTINTPILANGTNAFTKTGAGTVTLAASNTYTGNTYINAGTLQLGSGGTLGSLATSGTILDNGTFTVNRSNAATQGTDFSGSPITGSGSFSTIGTGAVTLLAGNTFSGITNINSGSTLIVGNGGATGTIGSGAVTMNGILELNRSNGQTLANAISGGGQLMQLGTGTTVLTGTLSYTGQTTISAGGLVIDTPQGGPAVLTSILNNGTLTFNNSNSNGTSIGNSGTNGLISGTGNVSFLSDGTAGYYTLRGAATYTGTTTIDMLGTGTVGTNFYIGDGADSPLPSGSVVNLVAGNVIERATDQTIGGLIGSGTWTTDSPGNTHNLTFAVTSGSQTFSGIVAAGLTVFKSGAGTQVLAGNNGFTAKTTINGGTLQIGNGTTGTINGTTGTALTFTGSGVFNIAEAAGSSQGMGALTITTGDATIESTYGGSGTSTLTFSSFSRAAGATDNLVINGGTSSNNKIVLTGAAGGFIDQGTFFGGSNYAWQDTGFVRGINYTSPDTGAATTAGSTSGLPVGSYLQMTGNVSGQGSASITTLNISGNNTLTLNGGATLNLNGILQSGNIAGGSTISGGTALQGVSAGSELVIRTDGVNDALNINTPIIDNSTTPLTKVGAGTLSLTASNSYAGTTYVDNGILQIGAGGTAGTLGTGNVKTAFGGTLAFNRTDTNTISNVVSGGGALLQAGTGTTILTSAETYTGGTTISAGTLQISAGGSLTGSVIDNANLAFSAHTSAGETNNLISGSGNVSFANSGSAGAYYGVNTVTETYTGTTTFNLTDSGGGLNNGTTLGSNFYIEFGAALPSASVVNIIAGNVEERNVTQTIAGLNGTANGTWDDNSGSVTTLVINTAASTNYTFSGILNSQGQNFSLVKTGAGTQVLAGNNSYNTTTISAGTLQIGNGGSAGTLGITTTLTNNGTLVFNRSDNGLTFAPVISGTGSVVQNGSGTTALTGASNYTGGTTISAGTLELLNGGFIQGNVVDNGTFLLVPTYNPTVGSGQTLGTISGTGGLTLATTAANEWIGLYGGMSYSGTTTINMTGTGLGNTVFLQVANFAGNSGVNDISPTAPVVFTAGNVQQREVAQTIAGLSGAAGTTWTADNNGGNVHTLTINLASGSQTYAGTFVDTSIDTLSLVETGSGTEVLTGSNANFGTTTVSAGTLQIGAGGTAGALGSGAVTIASAGTLAYSLSSSPVVANTIGGAGTFLQNGTGTTILTGANNYTGPTVISSGSLQIGNAGTTGALGSGNTTINTGSSLITNESGSFTVASNISGGGSLLQNGSGTASFTGASTFTGGTTISAGTLQLLNAGSISGAVTDNGTLIVNRNTGGGTQLTGTGGLLTTVSGTGGLTLTTTTANAWVGLSAGLTYTGTTTINMTGGGIGTNVYLQPVGFNGGQNNDIPTSSPVVFTAGNVEQRASSQTIAGLSGVAGTTWTADNSAGAGTTRTLTINLASGTQTYAGTFVDTTVSMVLVKAGNGTEFLSGNSGTNLAGGVTISAGTLQAANSHAFGSGPTVIATGGTLAVGADSSTIGTVTTGGQTWNDGGTYAWKINTAGSSGVAAGTGGSGAIGGGSGTEGISWDQIVMNTLAVTSGSAPFTIAVSNTASNLTGTGYSWVIAQTTSSSLPSVPTGITPTSNLLTQTPTGGTSTLFALNTAGLTINSVTNPSSNNFSLELEPIGGSSDYDLVLDYNAAPEPGTTMLVLAGALPLLSSRRRRRKVDKQQTV